MKYKIKLFMSQYVKVGEEYQMVDVSREFTFNSWDDVQNFVGYLVGGANGAVKFEVQTTGEE